MDRKMRGFKIWERKAIITIDEYLIDKYGAHTEITDDQINEALDEITKFVHEYFLIKA